MPDNLIKRMLNPVKMLTLTSTERYFGAAEDPVKYIPADPIPGWSWAGPLDTSAGEINGHASRVAGRPAYMGSVDNPNMAGLISAVTCESAEALRGSATEFVNGLISEGWTLVRKGFLGDLSYELNFESVSEGAAVWYVYIIWVRGKVAGQVVVACPIPTPPGADPREETLKWVEKVDALMVPKISKKMLLAIGAGVGIGIFGLAYYVSR